MEYGTAILAVSAAVAIVAAVVDAYARRIPNWLVGPYLLAGLALRWAVEGRFGLWEGLAGIALGLLATVPLYLLGGLGLGDCKLLAALGAWVGLYHMIFVLFGTAIAGGILAVSYASWKGQLGFRIRNAWAVLGGWTKHGIRKVPEVSLDNPDALSIPYGPAIAVGVLFSMFYV